MKRALVQVMALCRTGDKRLAEPMLTQVRQRIYAALGGDESTSIRKLLATIGSDDYLSPVQLQAIIWTNADSLSTGPSGTNFNHKNIAFENIVSTMVSILSWFLCPVTICRSPTVCICAYDNDIFQLIEAETKWTIFCR